jgi:uncharacterized membrane protein
VLDMPEHVRMKAQRARQRAVPTHPMLLRDVTESKDAERAAPGAWIDGGAPSR